MHYGMEIAKSGAMTSMYRQNVAANNLANLDTVGFKPDFAAARQREVVRVEDGVLHLPSNAMLERLGAGAMMAPNLPQFTQGALRPTGNPLDVAIEGDGFFLVQRDAGDPNDPGVRLTRDGRFTADADGRLVQAGTGLPVLGADNQPIVLDRAAEAPRITRDGQVLQRLNGVDLLVGRLAVVDVPDRRELTKEGNALFRPSPAASNQRFPASGVLHQEHVETAAVNEISAMMEVEAASRSVAGNLGMVQYHDRLIEAAITRFGRAVA